MVFTRREVVDFILDLIGYTTNQPLHRFRLIEPAFGNGGFLLPIVERLLTAYRAQVQNHSTIVADLSAAVRAVEVHGDSIERTRAELLGTLQKHGITTEEAQKLLTAWIIEGDFLLVDIPQTFTHAVGNPPYVR